MAVSLKKEPPRREYTPVHLMDEEESIQNRSEQITSPPCEHSNSLYIEPISHLWREKCIRSNDEQAISQPFSKSDKPRRKYISSHLADRDIHNHKEQVDSSPRDETDESPEMPKKLRERFAEKIGDIWFEIRCFFGCEGFGPLIGITALLVISLLSIPFLNNLMSDITFDLSAVETSAEIVSIGTANNKELQGVTVMFTDIYGNEQRSKILIDKRENIKIGDIISIRYDPDHTDKVSVGKPIIGILDVKNLQ